MIRMTDLILWRWVIYVRDNCAKNYCKKWNIGVENELIRWNGDIQNVSWRLLRYNNIFIIDK